VGNAIGEIRKRNYSASHHCTAYRLGIEGDRYHYNDDGEPSHTAGSPILRQIDARSLTNILVVVTRYFGGTKLGKGGLSRAYGNAASSVLEVCQEVEHTIRISIRLRFAYDDTSPAMFTINQFDSKILETKYSDYTEMMIGVRRSQVEAFVSGFSDALRGRGDVEIQ